MVIMIVHVIHVLPITIGKQGRHKILNMRLIMPPQAKHADKSVWADCFDSLVASLENRPIDAGAATWLVITQTWNVMVIVFLVADFVGVDVAVSMFAIVARREYRGKLRQLAGAWQVVQAIGRADLS